MTVLKVRNLRNLTMPAAKRARAGSTTTLTVRTPAKAKARKSYVPRSPFRAGSYRRTGFPDQLMVTHKYVACINRSSAQGALAYYLFSANGLYDPDITSTGGQPLYFDQLSPIYDHYTVMASRIKVLFSVQGSIAGPQVYCALGKDDDINTNYTGISDFISDDNSSWGLTGGVANNPLRLKASFDARKTYGIKDIPGDSTMSGGAASNPAEQTYYRIAVQEAQFSNTANVNLCVEIEYDTVWRERKDVPLS